MSSSMLFLSLAATITTSQETCTADIRDLNAPFREAFENPGMDELKTLHTIFKYLPPSLETCVASYQSDDALQILEEEIDKCSNVVDQAEKIRDELLPNFNANSSQSFSNLCQPMSTDVLTCLTAAVPTLMDHLKTKSNGCCEAFFKDAEAMFGKSFEDVIFSVASKLMDVACSVQTPGFNENDSQTCAYTFYHALKATLTQDPLQLLGMFQLTNANACDAYNGEMFLGGIFDQDIALGDKMTNFVMGSCAVPIDNLLSELASFPFFQSDSLWSKLFAENQVVTVGEIIEYLQTSEIGTHFFDQEFDNLMERLGEKNFTLLNNFELNIPSGFADTCDFKSDIVLASPASIDQSDNSAASIDQSDNSAASIDQSDKSAAMRETTKIVGIMMAIPLVMTVLMISYL